MVEYGIRGLESIHLQGLLLSTIADMLLDHNVLPLLLHDGDGYFPLQYTRKEDKTLLLELSMG